MDYNYYMKLALKQAQIAFDEGEVPIGAVIVDKDGEIIGMGRNQTTAKGNALCHAEIAAINEACGKMGDWRLIGTALFVTIEPCPMCAGAVIMSRIPFVIFGARNPKAGCAGSIYNLLDEPAFNHRVNVTEGIMAEECGGLMTRFFRQPQKTIASSQF